MAFWHQRNASEAGIFIRERHFFDGSFAAIEEIPPSNSLRRGVFVGNGEAVAQKHIPTVGEISKGEQSAERSKREPGAHNAAVAG
ncbi:MAG: hypothetical protein DRI61_08790 [Chloroflexi bacterium]|nr:MAG: hypothetical protein DRI61_08790 [Chloroflexota bacterium]